MCATIVKFVTALDRDVVGTIFMPLLVHPAMACLFFIFCDTKQYPRLCDILKVEMLMLLLPLGLLGAVEASLIHKRNWHDNFGLYMLNQAVGLACVISVLAITLQWYAKLLQPDTYWEPQKSIDNAEVSLLAH
jgi:hypothetical protein